MARNEGSEQGDAGWGLTLAAAGVTVAALALTLLPGIALVRGLGRAWWVTLGVVAFVVARAKLLTMAWALFAFTGEVVVRERRSALATVQTRPRLSLAVLTVAFVAIAIPHC